MGVACDGGGYFGGGGSIMEQRRSLCVCVRVCV